MLEPPLSSLKKGGLTPSTIKGFGAPHLALGTSKGLLPILKKLSEWFEEEELEDLASTSPWWEGRRSSEGCGRFQSTLCGEDEWLFLLRWKE